MINKFKLNRVASALCLSSLAFSQLAYAQEQEAEAQSGNESAQEVDKDIEKIAVRGYLSSLQRSMAVKRDSSGVVDAVSAEDIGKFPDTNVAESLQRIPGVAISRERGEGKFVSVRGLGPAFTPSTLNGRTMVAGRTDLAAFTSFNPVAGRSFAFNILPSSVVSSLNVFKSPSADLIEGGIGGLIDMQTVRPLSASKNTLAFSAQGVYEDQAKETDPRLSVGYTTKFADDKVGVHVSGAFSQRSVLEERLWHWGWVPGIGVDDLGTDNELDYPDGAYAWNATPSALIGEMEHASVVGVLQFAPNDNLTSTVDVLYSEYTSDVNEMMFSHRAEDGSFTGDFDDDFIGVSNSFPFRMYDIGIDSSNGRLTRWSSYDPSGENPPKPVAFTSRQEKNTLKTETFAIGANVEYFADDWTLELDAAYSKAQSDWNMRWAGYEGDFLASWSFEDPSTRMPSIEVSMNPNDPTNDPNVFVNEDNWYMRGMTARLNEVEDEEISFKADFDYELEGDIFTRFEAGIRYADRTKTSKRWNSQLSNAGVFGQLAQTLGLPTKDSNGFLNVGQAGLPTSEMVGGAYDLVPSTHDQWIVPDVDALFGIFEGVKAPGADTAPIQTGKNLPFDPFAGFDVQEKSLAVYVKQNFELDLDMPISGNFGVRWVNTDNTSTGLVPTEDILVENNSLINDGNPQQVGVDTSYAEILPSFMAKMEITDELVARVGIGKSLTRPDLDKVVPNIKVEVSNPPTGSSGNPELDPFTAWNYDFSLEWYYDESGYVSAGVFMKDIDGFVQNRGQSNVTLYGQRFATFTTPDNVGTAELTGMELAYQQAFSFLPEPLNGMGIQLNYTKISSDTSYEEGFQLNSRLEAVGFQGLSEDNYNAVLFYEQEGFSARVSYNYRSEFFTGFNIFSPRVQEGYGQIDASIAYELSDNIELTFEAVNLSKDPFHHYDAADKDMVSEITRTGRKYFLGIRGSFQL